MTTENGLVVTQVTGGETRSYLTNPNEWMGNVLATTDPVTGVISLSGSSGTVIDPGSKEPARSFVLMGDSIVRTCNLSITTPTAIVRSNGTVTVTSTSHGVAVGQVVWVENINGSNGLSLQGHGTVLSADANTFTYSDSRSDSTAGATEIAAGAGGRTFSVRVEAWHNFGSWWAYLNGFYNCGLKLLANYGWGGSKLSDWVGSTELSEVVALNPPRVILCLGINDVMDVSRTLAAMKSDATTLLAALRNAGARIDIISILPLHRSHASYSAANVAKIIEMNRWYKAYAQTNSGVNYHDVFSAMVDPTNATYKGTARDNVTEDYIHPSAFGARNYIARTLYKNMAGAAVTVPPNQSPTLYGHPVPNPKTTSNADNYGNSATSNNIWDYAPWVNTTGGTWIGGAGTHAGLTIAANIRMDASANITITGDPTTARSDGFGYDQSLSITASGSGTVTIEARLTTGARATTSDVVRSFCELSLAGVSASNLKGVHSVTRVYDGGSASSYGYCLNVDADAAKFGTDDFAMTLGGIDVPVISAAGYIYHTVTLTFAAAGTLTGKFGVVSMVKNFGT